MTLSIGVELPEDHITQKCSIFGVTGTGKSNGVGVILEEYCKKKMPFVCIDVLGAHYGLATKYPVIIYGGKNGIEMDREIMGDYYAQLVFSADEHHLSFIFDFSEWNDFEMQLWMSEFLNRLFELHASDRKPRHIFVEEAEVFFPQVNYDEGKHSLLAGNKVMKRGRALGLGMTLISQRPQDVNKKTLSQSQCNFLLHLEGVPEMKVVREMLRSEEKDRRDELINIVTNADKGECLLYSPQWIGKPKSFKFRLRETFHAGYTPKLNEVIHEPELTHKVVPEIIHNDTQNNTQSEVKGKLSKNQMIFAIFGGIILYVLVTVI